VGRNNFHIPRQQLRRILLDALPPGVLQWGAPVDRLEQPSSPQPPAPHAGSSSAAAAQPARDGVLVHFKDGRPPFRATLAVGCDGIHSAVRQKLLGDPLRYLGYVVVLGIFDSQPYPLCRDRIFQMSDGATRIFVMPYSHTQHMWQVRARVWHARLRSPDF
jgi:salicylate hydroxylase